MYRKNNLQIELSNRVCQEKQKLFLQDHAMPIKTIIITRKFLQSKPNKVKS